MNHFLKKIAIPGLRWTLGLVVLAESCRLAFSASAILQFAMTGHPQRIRQALAGTEIVAALLFLAPAASVAGGSLLLIIFAFAIVLHFLQGQFDAASLLVYGMAVIVCMTQRNKEIAEVLHD